MAQVEFRALEYGSDDSFRQAVYRYEGDSENGWKVSREGKPHLDLPPGYRLLRTLQCGICSTDLARRYLPFPLPQIIGHEVLASDESGGLVAAEINASHFATGSPEARSCPLCRSGLHTHCPERLVLGIDRLPGGFGPWILVPWRNVVQIPSTLQAGPSILVEPFAAALHATGRMHLEGVKRVAVLGVGRLGQLIVAALRAKRKALGGSFAIEAVDRREKRLSLARALGADQTWSSPDSLRTACGNRAVFDVVVEATGSPSGLEAALLLASREVHVKSTTGRESFGLRHLTEMVVDEIGLAGFSPGREMLPLDFPERAGKALLIGPKLGTEPRCALESRGFKVEQVERVEDAACLEDKGSLLVEHQAQVVVVDSLAQIDRVLRPVPGLEQGLVRPRGAIVVADTGQTRTGILEPLLDRGLRISTSRCGDFHQAVPALESLSAMGVDLGAVITDRLPVTDLRAAFDRAASPDSIKVVVSQP